MTLRGIEQIMKEYQELNQHRGRIRGLNIMAAFCPAFGDKVLPIVVIALAVIRSGLLIFGIRDSNFPAIIVSAGPSLDY